MQGKLARRLYAPFFAKRYAGNSETKVLHDLDNEKRECEIDRIDSRKNVSMFEWLNTALEMGYRRCSYCMPEFSAGKSNEK